LFFANFLIYKIGLNTSSQFLLFGSLILGDVLFDELGKSSEISLTFIRFSSFVTFWVPFKSWVSSDLNTVSLVDCGVEFGNDDIFVVLEVSTELIPDWGKLFAVTAPWSVEFDEDILGWVHNELLEFSSDNDSNVSLSLWDSSGFEMWFERSIFDSIDEGTDLVKGDSFDVSIEVEFFHVSWEESSKSWEIFLSNSHEFSEFTLDLVGGSSVGEENLTLVGNSGLLEGLLESGFGISLSSE